jgi:hypothetical protein
MLSRLDFKDAEVSWHAKMSFKEAHVGFDCPTYDGLLREEFEGQVVLTGLQ